MSTIAPLFSANDLNGVTSLKPTRRDMVMELGAGVHRLVASSSFAADSDSSAGLEMQARLTQPVGERSQGFATLVQVAAPPACWEALGRWCMRQASHRQFGQSATSRSNARQYARLGWRVRHELERLAAHPAYHGQSVLGIEPLVLPAYRVADHDKDALDWPLAPTPGLAIAASRWAPGEVEVGEMIPWAAKPKGQVVTIWLWSPLTG